ncbi:cellulose binding domain-containing protein [Sorangium sp. So ce406]|uniref:cellulose binding domain-containing protein n=1 Tax=Sorangium sp. So ce406 TaxID=3133311 RepID=UPI003F5B8E45
MISSWSADVAVDGSEMTAASLPYNGQLDPGASTSFGFCANKTGAAWQPQVVSAAHR